MIPLPPQPEQPTAGRLCRSCAVERRNPLPDKSDPTRAVWVCPMCDQIMQKVAGWERAG